MCLMFTHPPTTEIYTLSLHDALPISISERLSGVGVGCRAGGESNRQGAVHARRHGVKTRGQRSEEHTSELQSRFDIVCRLLLEKKKLLALRLLCKTPIFPSNSRFPRL